MTKFRDEIDEAVYCLSLDTSYEMEPPIGDTDSYGAHYCYIDLRPSGPTDKLANVRADMNGALWAIVETDSAGFVEVEYFDDESDADKRWCEIEDTYQRERGAEEWDAILFCGYYGYSLSFEGVSVGAREYATYDAALVELAREMVRSGCFPDAFMIGERGDSSRIDEEVHALHDRGGDKMHSTFERILAWCEIAHPDEPETAAIAYWAKHPERAAMLASFV